MPTDPTSPVIAKLLADHLEKLDRAARSAEARTGTALLELQQARTIAADAALYATQCEGFLEAAQAEAHAALDAYDAFLGELSPEGD